MREDMYKVIVERPRWGSRMHHKHPAPTDLEESPRQEGLRKRHRNRKWLNENLNPLQRFLASQVGRSWDKVFSEICAGIDRRNTVQQHIHQHIDDFVAIRVFEVDGMLHVDRALFGRIPLGDRSAPEFYVDPRSGLLHLNKARIRARCRQRDAHREKARAHRGGLRDDRRIISATTQLHRVDGVWYRIELATVAGNEQAMDTLRRLAAKDCPRHDGRKKVRSNDSLFGDANVFARSKRQLSARELRHYRLHNDNA